MTQIHQFIVMFEIMLTLMSGCESSPSSTTMSAAPAGEALAGQVRGTIAGEPLAGVQVTIGDITATTDLSGYFRMTPGIGDRRHAILSGEAIYPRTFAFQRSSTSPVQLDAIEKDQGFHLEFYRELARGNHPHEGDLFPIHRWTSTQPPTFYIDTNASAAVAGEISSATIDLTRQIITQVLPVFSGGRYATAAIELRRFSSYTFAELPEHAIVISYDDSLYARGGVGLTITEPDFISPEANSIVQAWIFLIDSDRLYAASGFSRQALLAHELGHAFGYRHTSRRPSIMQKTAVFTEGLYSEADRLHMAVMYARPVGNRDLDNDPTSLTGGQIRTGWPRREFFWESCGCSELITPENSLVGEFLRSRSAGL